MPVFSLMTRGHIENRQYKYKYRLITELGKGSFGEVWKAKDEDGYDCAVKKIKFPFDVEAIVAEISHLKQSDHVNLPQFMDSL